jgi:hypothetical protein
MCRHKLTVYAATSGRMQTWFAPALWRRWHATHVTATQLRCVAATRPGKPSVCSGRRLSWAAAARLLATEPKVLSEAESPMASRAARERRQAAESWRPLGRNTSYCGPRAANFRRPREIPPPNYNWPGANCSSCGGIVLIGPHKRPNKNSRA